ncbi:TetR/AcrR family transcriptional regulator [Curtobacterium sp. RRHDQ10]|uniref:TetR/AcrR family transcriptional regulator n=1 Tax=Curtobacterium phyllosphaerae TaxID=3413379 RepID=UPI003BF3F552
MARWQPDARGRLLRAAIDLFAEQGYDATTTAQIAARAGLTKTTFFRHFPDKREVLFFGQPVLVDLARTAARTAPSDGTPMDAVLAAVDAMTATAFDEQREYAPRLQEVVAANIELRERAVFKQAVIARAIADGLAERGVAEPTASLAADLGARAYHDGFDRWIEPGNTTGLPALARAALDELRAAAARLA